MCNSFKIYTKMVFTEQVHPKEVNSEISISIFYYIHIESFF